MDLSLMHTVGNLELLSLHKVAFLSSRRCPPAARTSAIAWAGVQRDRGSCVVSGFQSSLEKEVLQELLHGTQPLVVVLARGLGSVPADFSRALEEGRLLVMTRYAESVTHACEESCYQRNRLMMELAQETVIGYAAPGGALEKLCHDFDGRKPILFLHADTPSPAVASRP